MSGALISHYTVQGIISAIVGSVRRNYKSNTIFSGARRDIKIDQRRIVREHQHGRLSSKLEFDLLNEIRQSSRITIGDIVTRRMIYIKAA